MHIQEGGLIMVRWIKLIQNILLYMIWSTTQHYADFAHQIETLNSGEPFSEAQWQTAKLSVKTIILKGVGLSPT